MKNTVARAYLLLATTLLFLGCYEAERQCDDFKTGTFKSIVTTENKTFESTFVRTKSLQIETYNGKTDTSSVRWINNCEMIFHHLNPKSMSEKKDDHIKILTTTDSSYTFEYSQVGKHRKIRGIAIKTN